MAEKIITVLVVSTFFVGLTLIFTQYQRLVDWMDNPENPANIEYAKRHKTREDTKIKWCRDQNGLAKFNKYNEYQGCEVK